MSDDASLEVVIGLLDDDDVSTGVAISTKVSDSTFRFLKGGTFYWLNIYDRAKDINENIETIQYVNVMVAQYDALGMDMPTIHGLEPICDYVDRFDESIRQEDVSDIMALAGSNKEHVLVDHAFRCGVREGESYGE